MIAVLSATEHDFYAMPLPFAVYSWLKAGANTVYVFAPFGGEHKKIDLALKYCPNTTVYWFNCEEKRIPTYSQVIRNFGAMVDIHLPFQTMLWTGDSDMCVFTDYFKNITEGINVVGADLTSNDQYPMCFIGMNRKDWLNKVCLSEVCDENSSPKTHRWLTPQESTSKLIDPIEGINIRGEQWNFDQWFIRKTLDEHNANVIRHNRSNGITQFATRRADRDGWHFNPADILDAHLPRPLTDDENFNKVYELFKYKYPEDDLTWMKEYQQAYKKLL